MLLALISAIASVSLAATCPGDENKSEASPEQIEFFESKIRPIFVKHCYECHSVDSGDDLEGGLLLDSRWGWETGGDSGPSILPGDPDESLVMHAIGYEEDVVSAMPPSSKLTPQQIELIEKWIRDGATDPREKADGEAHAPVEKFDLQERFDQHWSWRPIETPQIPAVSDDSWPKNFIDSFVLHKLDREDIRPAEPASNEIWLRRVYLDLIGLPPTIEQIDAFLLDDSDAARENVVADLLESQHFGEKWARHWMDLVRYAETYGHEFDYAIPHPHEYRDYLIRAFNADVPYDQLIREHVAGDLLEGPRLHPDDQFNESIIGTGFWYLHEATHAPTDVLKNESDITDNQIDVFGKTFLGLTVACARCHDHKFDAISTADYYALSGYMQSSCRQIYPLDPNQKISQAVQQLVTLQSDYAKARRAGGGLFDDANSPAVYMEAAIRALRKGAQPDAKLPVAKLPVAKLPDARLLARWTEVLRKADPSLQSTNPADVVAFVLQKADANTSLAKHLAYQSQQIENYEGRLFADFGGSELPDDWSTSGQAFEVVNDQSRFVPINDQPRLQTGSIDSGVYGTRATGSLRSPTFQISASNIHLRMRASGDVKVQLIVDNYQMAAFSQLLFRGVQLDKKTTDTEGQWAWKHLGHDLKKYVGHNAYLEFLDEGNGSIAVDEIWFSDQPSPPLITSYFAQQMQRSLDDTDAFWKSVQQDYRHSAANPVVDWLLENELIDFSRISDAVAKVETQAMSVANSIPMPRYVLAIAQGTRENSHVYVRGNSSMLGEELPPRNLQALGGRAGDRLQLANEIASIKNPLTARVLVNRLWHHLFDRGIVPTTDDFGPQGQPPSHPELLDALAMTFANDGWSIKKMIRTIVLSQTYAQSSVTNPTNDGERIANVDPTNSLLYRMRVRRLPAESIRDQVLAVSGRLTPTQFGESVPTYRTPFMTGRGARASGPLDGAGRRSIYLAVYRNFLNPFMSTFDVPNPFGPKGRRSVSNVPAQSLTLLNDPFILEQAKLWAIKSLKTDMPDQQRIKSMIRSAHGVTPSQSQIDRLLEFVNQHPDAGEPNSGEPHSGKNEQQVWADVAHMLLNMKAFYFLR